MTSFLFVLSPALGHGLLHPETLAVSQHAVECPAAGGKATTK